MLAGVELDPPVGDRGVKAGGRERRQVTPCSVSSLASRCGGERGGARDHDLAPAGLVRAGDAGQRRALPGSGLPLDHHEAVLTARQLDRRALLLGQTPARPGQLAVEALGLAGGRGGRERLDPVGGETFGDLRRPCAPGRDAPGSCPFRRRAPESPRSPGAREADRAPPGSARRPSAPARPRGRSRAGKVASNSVNASSTSPGSAGSRTGWGWWRSTSTARG